MIFSWYIVGYLFMAGVAGGAFFASFAVCLWDRWHATESSAHAVAAVQPGFFLAPVVALAAIDLLLLDLGNPDRILPLLMMPFDSVMNIGSWFLGLFFLLASALALTSVFRREVPRSIMMALGLPAALCAVGVMSYTGVLLSSMVSVEFWYSPWLVVLFVASSLTTGAAAIVICGSIAGTPASSRNMSGLWKVCLAFSIAEVVALLAFVAFQMQGSPMATESCTMLLTGPLAGAFWLGVLGMGFLLPWGLHALKALTGLSVAMLVSSASALAGGFMLRYCVVAAGLFSPLVLSAPGPVL